MSKVLSLADDVYHIHKTRFKVLFVWGAKGLWGGLNRLAFHPELTKDVRCHEMFLSMCCA